MVIFIVLVVIVYRRLGRERRHAAGREAEDDYSALTPAGYGRGLGHSGHHGAIQLDQLGFPLANPSYGGQRHRPVSDYAVIGEVNPYLAKHVTKRSPGGGHPDYSSPYETRHTPALPCRPPLTLPADQEDDGKDWDYLTPSSPRGRTEVENQPDYLTPFSPRERTEVENQPDYLTSSSPRERTEVENQPDYLTSFSLRERTEVENQPDYPTIRREDVNVLRNSDYPTHYPTPCRQNADVLGDSDYLTPRHEDANVLRNSDYLTPFPRLDN
ncbi:uncharacterized protein [Littorina saxatilis]|uniref:uncharacterized protein n=1 Tax=Littorina saxatilis TaxID=31220 RepID=UPI0038B60729